MRSRLLSLMALVSAVACIDVDARSRSGSEAITGPGTGGGTVVTSVAMSPLSINLQSGGTCTFVATHQITATARTSSGSVVTSNPQDFTWSSDNVSIGSVDQNGRVTLTGAVGTLTVMAVHKASGIPGSTPITVTACGTQPPSGVTGVTVNPPTITLSVSGSCHPQTAQLSATVTGDPKTVNWASNNFSRVTVDQNGFIRAVAVGSADVSATSTANQSASGFSRVTVVDCPSNPPPNPGTITIDVNPPTFNGVVGGTSSWTATVNATGGLPTSVVWSLSDATCGTMTANGHSFSVLWTKNCPLVTAKAASTHNASIFDTSTGSISSGNIVCTATSSSGTEVSVNETWTVTANCTNQFGVPFDPYGYSSDPARVLITGSTRNKVINGQTWPVGPQFTLRAVARGNARLTIQADVSDVTAIAVIDFTVQ